MVVSVNEEAQSEYKNPQYRDSQKGTPTFGKPLYRDM